MAQTNIHFVFELTGIQQDSEEPLNPIHFDVVEFYMVETLNQPYALNIDLISDDANIDFGRVLDQNAVLTIWQGNTAIRHIHGVVSDFSQGTTGFKKTRYHAVIEPQLARTQLHSDWKIYQQKTIPEILADIYKEDKVFNYSLQARLPHLQREFCVQADETDFEFIQRLNAEEGFVYRFEHTAQGHQLLISDIIQSFGSITKPMVSMGGSAGKIGSVLQRLGLNLDDLQGITKLTDLSRISQLKQLGDIQALADIAQLQKYLDAGEITKQVQGYASDLANSVDGAVPDTAEMLMSGLGINSALPIPGVLYQPNPGGDQQWPALHTFTYQEKVRTARQTQRDHFFKNPRYSQQHKSTGHDLSHQSSEYEYYDYPGRYKQDAAGNPFTRTRLLSHRRDAKTVIAKGNDARIEPGVAFELHGHPRNDLNTMWRPVRVEHHGKQHTSAEEEAAGAQVSTSYSQTAELVPAAANWKAPIPPKPRITGPQMAVVVGPENEEIYCDEWGRVKIQFPWDRIGKNDEHSSCWIRVAQGWGIGAGDGQQSIPRIGQPVVVEYLDSDPDQPIVIARTNDVLNPPPYELPKHKTRSTWRSQTHKGEGFNEIRFEDERQQEEIYIHAQKDQNNVVNHDESTYVGHDRTEQVEHDEKITIGHDRTETVRNDESHTIGNDRNHRIKRDDILLVERQRKIVIGQNHEEEVHGDRKEVIHANNTQDNKGYFNHKVADYHHLEAGNEIIRKTKTYRLGATEEIIFEAPGSRIILSSAGILLDGPIIMRGRMNQSGQSSAQAMAIESLSASSPTKGLSCWVKAAEESSALLEV